MSVINPNSPDVEPLVPLTLTGMQFTSITTRLIGAPTLSMPDFRAAPPLEDGSGSLAN
jgi:hypothetical protein